MYNRHKFQEGGQLASLYQALTQSGMIDMPFEQFQQLPPQQIQQLVAQVRQQAQQQAPQQGGMPMMQDGGEASSIEEDEMFNPGLGADILQQGLITAAGAVGSELQGEGADDKNVNIFGDTLTSAAQTAGAFAPLGPWGMLAGAGIGAATGLMKGMGEKEAYLENLKERSKARNVGSLGTSYNALAAHGGNTKFIEAAEKAEVNRIKNLSQKNYGNYTGSKIANNSKGIGRAGIDKMKVGGTATPTYADAWRKQSFTQPVNNDFYGEKIGIKANSTSPYQMGGYYDPMGEAINRLENQNVEFGKGGELPKWLFEARGRAMRKNMGYGGKMMYQRGGRLGYNYVPNPGEGMIDTYTGTMPSVNYGQDAIFNYPQNISRKEADVPAVIPEPRTTDIGKAGDIWYSEQTYPDGYSYRAYNPNNSKVKDFRTFPGTFNEYVFSNLDNKAMSDPEVFRKRENYLNYMKGLEKESNKIRQSKGAGTPVTAQAVGQSSMMYQQGGYALDDPKYYLQPNNYAFTKTVEPINQGVQTSKETNFRNAMVKPQDRNPRPKLNYDPRTPLMLQKEYNSDYHPLINYKSGYESMLDKDLGAWRGVNPEPFRGGIKKTEDYLDEYTGYMDYDTYASRMDELEGSKAALREIEKYNRAYDNWKQGKGTKRKYRQQGGLVNFSNGGPAEVLQDGGEADVEIEGGEAVVSQNEMAADTTLFGGAEAKNASSIGYMAEGAKHGEKNKAGSEGIPMSVEDPNGVYIGSKKLGLDGRNAKKGNPSVADLMKPYLKYAEKMENSSDKFTNNPEAKKAIKKQLADLERKAELGKAMKNIEDLMKSRDNKNLQEVHKEFIQLLEQYPAKNDILNVAGQLPNPEQLLKQQAGQMPSPQEMSEQVPPTMDTLAAMGEMPPTENMDPMRMDSNSMPPEGPMPMMGYGGNSKNSKTNNKMSRRRKRYQNEMLPKAQDGKYEGPKPSHYIGGTNNPNFWDDKLDYKHGRKTASQVNPGLQVLNTFNAFKGSSADYPYTQSQINRAAMRDQRMDNLPTGVNNPIYGNRYKRNVDKKARMTPFEGTPLNRSAIPSTDEYYGGSMIDNKMYGGRTYGYGGNTPKLRNGSYVRFEEGGKVFEGYITDLDADGNFRLM